MLAELHEYMAGYSQKSADKYIEMLFQYTERLKQYPELCAPCRNPKLKQAGFRCCTFKNHIIIYEFIDGIVNILAIIHAKRNPRDFERIVRQK